MPPRWDDSARVGGEAAVAAKAEGAIARYGHGAGRSVQAADALVVLVVMKRLARPPSPLKPKLPLPATVVMVPAAAGNEIVIAKINEARIPNRPRMILNRCM